MSARIISPLPSSARSAKRASGCHLLSLPAELLLAIIFQVRRSDEIYEQEKRYYDRKSDLTEDGTRVDPFEAIDENEAWSHEYGNATRALYGTCRTTRDHIKPYIYESLRLSRGNSAFYLSNLQFVVAPFVKTVVLDSLDDIDEDEESFLRTFLIQLINFKQLDQLEITEDAPLEMISSILPLPGEEYTPESHKGSMNQFQTMSVLSDQLAKNIKSIDLATTDGFQLSRRFPAVKTFSFFRCRHVESLEEISDLGEQTSPFQELQHLDLDLRTSDEMDGGEMLPPSFIEKVDEFPWKSSTTLTQLSYMKNSFSIDDHTFIKQFQALKSIKLVVQSVSIPPKTPLPALKKLVNFTASGTSEFELSTLLGLFSNSPLQRVSITLNPGTKVKDCSTLYATLQHHKPTLRNVQITTEGEPICGCDRRFVLGIPISEVPHPKLATDSDEMWRKIMDGERVESCHSKIDVIALSEEMKRVMGFGIRKLEMCKQMDDEAGIWELARWMVGLRARKRLEDL